MADKDKDKLILYQVVTPEHTILVHAANEDDALFFASEGWNGEVEGAEVSAFANPEEYSDLVVGTMLDVRKEQ
jgi:hypothetical protein